MKAFRIRIAGIEYIGLFTSQVAAANDAENRYPHAWPAQVFNAGGPHG